ncbi:MAG: FAD-dependent oxidoreductase [Oscillospiraceae bacterium]|jgi:glycine/D-amino acid oxidase-like deaminating enzyme|nr:FAD-dependent oxidoreductase [Oscillospiraceae bacterium]
MTVEVKRQSFWQLEKMHGFHPLPGDIQANAVIVGAGLSGLLCAYFLYRKGVENIVLIDADGPCSGVTASTTAKITSQHGLIYAKLIKGLGKERALQYLAANESAIQHYGEIIRREMIDCGFTPCNAWIYTTNDRQVEAIEDEARAAQQLGIDAELEPVTELPFAVRGAVRFPNQAYFHPLRFASHICGVLTRAGCKIYTHTKATAAEAGIVYTDKGNIRAKHIISCTHYPFIDKHSLLFARIYQDRSYVAALKDAGVMRDMYLDCADGGFSFRPQKDTDGRDMVLFGAYDHKTGHDSKELHYDGLLKDARRLYPESRAAYLWSAQDCMTHDGVPYIGRYDSAGENIYLATGFNKWGMTSGMAAAEIISDMITRGRSDFEDAFRLDRGDVGLQAKSFVKTAADIAGNFASHIIPPFKPVCTHMGCPVKWNEDENTWDCTCHGSRFDREGKVISGPALKPLERIDGIEPL